MSHPSRPEGWDDDHDDEDPDDGVDLGPLPKPDELLALHDVTAEMFDILKEWFDIGPSVTLDVAAVDSAVTELGDPQMVAALAMRKLQALHLLATPGVRTASDVVVAIVNDLERALIQAPNMWLKRQAATVDWDTAFEAMSRHSGDDQDDVPVQADDIDPEVLHFRALHAALHEAMFAVIEVSEGEIRELE